MKLWWLGIPQVPFKYPLPTKITEVFHSQKNSLKNKGEPG